MAVDDYTVDIKTNKPYGLTLNMCTYIFPMDSVFYSGTDEKGLAKDAIVKTEHFLCQRARIGHRPLLRGNPGTGPEMGSQGFP